MADLLRTSGLPVERFLPTHLNRARAVLEEAIAFGRLGGYLDLTASITPADGYERALAIPSAIRALIEAGMISRGDCDLFEFADTAEEAWQAIKRRGLIAHP